MRIRKLKREDIQPCIELFKQTVRSINAADYSAEQLDVWAPDSIDLTQSRWQALLENISLVAEYNNDIVGFADMTVTGYLDRLYVHKAHQREGIATALLRSIEILAKQQGIHEIITEASITAKPFFESMSYVLLKKEQKVVNGMQFTVYIMRKKML